VRCRYVVVAPPCYIHLLLGHRFTPRELWLQVVEENAESCAPFIHWCQQALTSQNAAGNASTLSQARLTRQPRESQPLRPSYSTTTNGSQSLGGQLGGDGAAAELRQMQAYMQARDVSRETREAEEKSVQGFYKTRFQSLLQVSRAAKGAPTSLNRGGPSGSRSKSPGHPVTPFDNIRSGA